MTKRKKIGWVWPGAAFNGPFQAGVAKFFEEKGFTFDFNIASSVGILNTCILNAKNGSAEKLCQFWRTAYFWHFFYPAWKDWLKNRRYDSLCSKELLEKKIKKLVGDDYWRPKDGRIIEVSVLNLDTGRVEYISSDDPEFPQAIWAGVGFPPFAPAVYLPSRGHQYIDGGLGRNYMIQRCFEKGCDRVIVVNIVESKKTAADSKPLKRSARIRSGEEVFWRTTRLVIKRVFADSSGGEKTDESKVFHIYPPGSSYFSTLCPSNLWFRRMIRVGYREAEKIYLTSQFQAC